MNLKHKTINNNHFLITASEYLESSLPARLYRSGGRRNHFASSACSNKKIVLNKQTRKY